MINSSMTVREVAIEVPQSTRLFEKLKIDYCCGGNRSLIEACNSAGLEIDEMLGMLKTASHEDKSETGTIDFQQLPIADLAAFHSPIQCPREPQTAQIKSLN